MKAKKKAMTAKKAAPAKAAAPVKKPTTYAKERYFAKGVNGKGYLFDKKFSANVPIAVETSLAFAQRQAERFNAEEEAERAAIITKKCPAKAAAKKPMRTVRKPMTQKKPAAKKSEYAKGKEAARNEAIQWSNDFADSTMSYREIRKAQARFERLGKRYGLTKEFRENGII